MGGSKTGRMNLIQHSADRAFLPSGLHSLKGNSTNVIFDQVPVRDSGSHLGDCVARDVERDRDVLAECPARVVGTQVEQGP